MMYPGYNRTFYHITRIAVLAFIITTVLFLTNEVFRAADSIMTEKLAVRYDVTVTNLATKEKTEYKHVQLTRNFRNFIVTDDKGRDIIYSYEGNSLSAEKAETETPAEKTEPSVSTEQQ